jgi:hypothetical protein
MTKTLLTIGSIEQGLVTRAMGRLAAADLRTLRAVLAQVIG